MNLFRKISHLLDFKNYIYLFLMFFSMNHLFVAEAHQNKYLTSSMQEENKLSEFHSQNEIKYIEHDNFDNQLKMLFGYDPENPGTSFFPDELIINYSDSLREMYKFKLNDMTINKIIYNIER